MNICVALAAKEREKKARYIKRNLALATEENSQIGLPMPFCINHSVGSPWPWWPSETHRAGTVASA